LRGRRYCRVYSCRQERVSEEEDRDRRSRGRDGEKVDGWSVVKCHRSPIEQCAAAWVGYAPPPAPSISLNLIIRNCFPFSRPPPFSSSPSLACECACSAPSCSWRKRSRMNRCCITYVTPEKGTHARARTHHLARLVSSGYTHDGFHNLMPHIKPHTNVHLSQHFQYARQTPLKTRTSDCAESPAGLSSTKAG
jgi:hypothetical protein